MCLSNLFENTDGDRQARVRIGTRALIAVLLHTLKCG